MANLSKFHVVFSSSTLIRLDKDAFEGHLCQTVNNFVKQNESSLLSPLRKRRPPQHIKHIRNTRVSRIPTFDEPATNNKALPITTHPKVLGLTLDPKLTYSTHIHNISVQAHKPLQIIKALTATGWGKQKETLMATYKAVM